MKYFPRLFFTLFLLSSNTYAVEQQIEIFEQFDDLKMVAFLNVKDIENNPVWNPGLTPPPLTVGEAIQTLKNAFEIGAIQEIEIRLVPGNKKKWHYLIKTTNDAMKSKVSIYVVLMDGVVVPAIIEPQGYK